MQLSSVAVPEGDSDSGLDTMEEDILNANSFQLFI